MGIQMLVSDLVCVEWRVIDACFLSDACFCSVAAVPGELASNADIEAVAEPGAAGIEVCMDFVESGMSKTTRGPDTLSGEERARPTHSIEHLVCVSSCGGCSSTFVQHQE